jgi:hypothetical protein
MTHPLERTIPAPTRRGRTYQRCSLCIPPQTKGIESARHGSRKGMRCDLHTSARLQPLSALPLTPRRRSPARPQSIRSPRPARSQSDHTRAHWSAIAYNSRNIPVANYRTATVSAFPLGVELSVSRLRCRIRWSEVYDLQEHLRYN